MHWGASRQGSWALHWRDTPALFQLVECTAWRFLTRSTDHCSHTHTQKLLQVHAAGEVCALEISMQILCGHVFVITPLPMDTGQLDIKMNVQMMYQQHKLHTA